MKIINIKTSKLLMPSYVINCIKKISWLQCDDECISFHPDDLIMILYGTRGTTSHSGPEMIKYGANTTSYQIFSPKLPQNHLYLGDGGSGILEIDTTVIGKCFMDGINPFAKGTTEKDIGGIISTIVNTYTHYHYDHLHFGAPLAGMFHANSIKKRIIGGDDPKTRFKHTFRRPDFPRDFGEMHGAFDFHNISDPRSAVIILLPDGDYRTITTSHLDELIRKEKPQIKHRKIFHDLYDCVVVKCYPANHPDPCISYRYENYNDDNELNSCITFMTDHDISETDFHIANSYFRNHVEGSDFLYIDGQYDENSYIPGFGHGRVEIIGKAAANLDLKNIGIGHHNPTRKDIEVDVMIQKARDNYKNNLPEGKNPDTKIIGASDRMMVFVPGKSRNINGIVIGLMDIGIGKHDSGEDDIVDLKGISYEIADLTRHYKLIDYTRQN